MSELDKALEQAKAAIINLERVRKDPNDEYSLLVAHSCLKSAERSARRAFPELGFLGPYANPSERLRNADT
jgi:hypothetical protein